MLSFKWSCYMHWNKISAAYDIWLARYRIRIWCSPRNSPWSKWPKTFCGRSICKFLYDDLFFYSNEIKKRCNSNYHLSLIQVPRGSKSSLQALPFFSFIMSISAQIHMSSTQVSFHIQRAGRFRHTDKQWWVVANVSSKTFNVFTTTKRKVIIHANIWFHWYCILATPSVKFICHPIWRGIPITWPLTSNENTLLHFYTLLDLISLFVFLFIFRSGFSTWGIAIVCTVKYIIYAGHTQSQVNTFI